MKVSYSSLLNFLVKSEGEPSRGSTRTATGNSTTRSEERPASSSREAAGARPREEDRREEDRKIPTALYTNFRGGGCLTIIGTEGDERSVAIFSRKEATAGADNTPVLAQDLKQTWPERNQAVLLAFTQGDTYRSSS